MVFDQVCGVSISSRFLYPTTIPDFPVTFRNPFNFGEVGVIYLWSSNSVHTDSDGRAGAVVGTHSFRYLGYEQCRSAEDD